MPFIGGKCFDVQQNVAGTSASTMTDLAAECQAMGLEPALNAQLGHGILQLDQLGALFPGLSGGSCAYMYSPSDLEAVPDWKATGAAEVLFRLMRATDGHDPYNQLLDAAGGTKTTVTGAGAEATMLDNDSFIAADGKGSAVWIFVLFPPSLAAKQAAIAADFINWANAALKQAAAVPSH